MKTDLIKNEEARFRASLLKQTRKGRKAVYSLRNAKEAINTRVNFGGGLGIYRKNLNEATKEKRYQIRERYKGIQNDEIRQRNILNDYSKLSQDKFVESEKTLATKVRQPKKLMGEKVRKIERSFEKNQNDAKKFTGAEMQKIWERYNKGEKKNITFRLFESKMKQSKFRNDVSRTYQ